MARAWSAGAGEPNVARMIMLAVVLQLALHPRESVPIVEVRVNGVVRRFLVDTGSSRTLVAQEIASVLAPARSFFRKDAGLEVAGKYWEVDLDIGGRQWPKRLVGAIDMTRVREVFGKDIAGILGQDVLREFDVVKIDYRAATLTLE